MSGGGGGAVVVAVVAAVELAAVVGGADDVPDDPGSGDDAGGVIGVAEPDEAAAEGDVVTEPLAVADPWLLLVQPARTAIVNTAVTARAAAGRIGPLEAARDFQAVTSYLRGQAGTTAV